MKQFSPETVRELIGLYIPIYDDEDNGFERIIPSEEPLTVDNFGIVMNGNTYTADDFEWYEEDGSDRDFIYDDNAYIYEKHLPDEVFCLLNTIICMKFATSNLADAKAKVDATDNNEAKKAINEAIENFNKATETEEKLQIASDALYDAAQVFEGIDKDFYITFDYAADVISEVISELEDRA